MQRRIPRIAVTGIGVVSALGAGAAESFARLVRGISGIAPLTLFDTDGLRSRIAATVPDFETAHGFSRTDALALAAAREALDSASLRRGQGALGFSIGGTTGSMLETELELALQQGPAEARPRVQRLLSHPLSTTVRVLEPEIGPFTRTATSCSACSSGALAIIQGAHWIASGEAEQVLAGGADALCRMTFVGFNALGAVDPAACRPFDRGRNGLSVGEGAAFLVLETEERARARGAAVRAWLSGWAAGAEAHHVTHPDPSGARAAGLITDALATAGLLPSDIDYVNAHGTATQHNDAMEAEALRRAFGASLSDVRVSSNKGQIGHTLGAAGAIEAAFTVLGIEAGVVPATVGLLDPESPDLRHVRGASERAPLRAAISNSFGFGGMDAVLVFEAAGAIVRPARPLVSELVVSGASALAGELFTGAACAELTAPGGDRQELAGDALAELVPERSRRFDGGTAWSVRAIEAALAAAAVPPERAGLALGSAYGPVERSMRFLERMLGQGARAVSPAEFPHLVQSAAAGNASIYLGLQGPVFAAIAGAASAEAALARAVSCLELGLAEVMVAGATETYDAFVAELGPLRRDAGTVSRSEGGGFVVLETRAHALRRGVTPRVVLRAHEERRGPPRLDGSAFEAPVDRTRACVVLASLDPLWSAPLDQSVWADLPRVDVRACVGHHEAVGGVALAVAVALVERGATDVLVLSGDAQARYVTRFSRSEPGV